MKVYLELPVENRGLQRVYDALVKYAPSHVQVVSDPMKADLTVLHVYGRHTTTQSQINALKAAGKQYVMIQYALRSTMRPSTIDWLDMWQGANLVWSYYYLPELMFQDGIGTERFNFYNSPLGADPKTFYYRDSKSGHNACVIATCSQHALSESVKECVIAAQTVKKKVFHLGHDLRRGDDIFCRTGISDNELAYYYSRCEFVSGLRRVEGFELPAVEGLLCGARPIMFDKPHYRQWFEGLAIFIPENSREDVTNKLTYFFTKGASPVSTRDIEIAKERFSWETIINGFWSRIN